MMTAQELLALFAETFDRFTGRIALRDFEGVIHAYPMRGFKFRTVRVGLGQPMCGADIRFMAATCRPTADAPTCSQCLQFMEAALKVKSTELLS